MFVTVAPGQRWFVQHATDPLQPDKVRLQEEADDISLHCEWSCAKVCGYQGMQPMQLQHGARSFKILESFHPARSFGLQGNPAEREEHNAINPKP